MTYEQRAELVSKLADAAVEVHKVSKAEWNNGQLHHAYLDALTPVLYHAGIIE